MAKRVFLHIGTPKTGTTFLQSVVWANKDVLKSQGLLLPLEKAAEHFHLSVIAREAEPQLANLPEVARSAWPRMLDQVSDWDGDALISHELFSMSTPRRAEWTIDQLRSVSDEVHIIITARDLARQVPAEWQQTVKHGRAHRIREFYQRIKAHDETIVFWRAQDLIALLEHWSRGLPAEHVHIVTVPRPGAPKDELWNRFAGLIGIDPTTADQTVNRPNESLGLAEIETLRRVNEITGFETMTWRRKLLTRAVLADIVLASRPNPKKFAPPEEVHPWVVETGTTVVNTLKASDYDVVGDLDDLLPAAEPVHGPVPDDVAEDEVAEVAVDAIARLLDRMQNQQIKSVQDRLKEADEMLERRATRIRNLETQLRGAVASYERERDLPLWKHAGRRARSAKRAVLRQEVPKPKSR